MRSIMTEHPLKTYRKNRQMTQGELASVLGISDAMVTHIENGRRPITPAKAVAWAPILGISREALCPEIFGEKAA